MTPDRLLQVNGAIVLAAGVLCGGPYYLAIVRAWPAGRRRGWRVAHATLIADGLLLLVTAGLLHGMALDDAWRGILAWSMTASGWAFVVALAGGAATGRRGLVPWPAGANTFFFVGHVVGAVGSLVGVALLVAGLVR